MATESARSGLSYRAKEITNRILLLEVSSTEETKKYKELTIREWLQEITEAINKELIHSTLSSLGTKEPSSIPIRPSYSMTSLNEEKEEVKQNESSVESSTNNIEFSISASIGNAISILEGVEMQSPINSDQSNNINGNLFVPNDNYRIPNIPSSTSLPSLDKLVNESDLSHVDPVASSSSSSSLALINHQSNNAHASFRKRASISKPKTSHECHLPDHHHNEHISSFYHSQPKPKPAHVEYSNLDPTHADNNNNIESAAVLELRIRDLRRLDFSANANEDITVQVRRHVVLFSADPVRAVITATKLWIVIPPGADTLMKYVDEYLQEWWDAAKRNSKRHQNKKSNSVKNLNNIDSLNSINSSNHPGSRSSISGIVTPVTDVSMENGNHNCTLDDSHYHADLHFEGHCYETLLSTTKHIIDSEASLLIKRGQKFLQLLRMKNIILTYDAQANIASLKSSLSKLIVKIQKYQKSLDAILDDEETTALMNLSHLLRNPRLYVYPISDDLLILHEEVEQSLEGYLIDFATIDGNLEVISNQLNGFEIQAAVRLDASRNLLLTMNIILMIFMCFCVFGSYIAGIFAVNLNNSVQLGPIHGIFVIIFAGTGGLIFVGTYGVYKLLVFMEYVTEVNLKQERLLKSVHI